MPTTLITGANRSLGHEAARRLVAAGHDVIIGARDPERGRKAADELGARFVQLDVTDDASVQRAAAEIEALDVLVNNAGVLGRADATVADTTADDIHAVYDVNVYGVVRVTRAFLPHLERSDNPVVVNVTSGLGSFAVTSDPERVESTIHNLAYPSSKAALNMLTAQYAKAFPHIRINMVDPGYTATDFNGHSGPQTVTEGTDRIVELAQLTADGPTGSFSDRHGAVAW